MSFSQLPNRHLMGYGCPKCAYINRKLKNTKSFEEFLITSKRVHNNKYDYTKSNYKNTRIPITIICPKHGEFNQLPYVHMRGNGCSLCGNNNISNKLSMGLEEFISRSIELFGDKFDYSLVEYINANTKVKITCPTHGLFQQTPYCHLTSTMGCPYCKESKLEKEVATLLETLDIEFIRQHKFKESPPISNMPFDFFIPSLNLVIECHGSQHFKENHFFHRTEEVYQERIKNDKLKEDFCKTNNINFIISTNPKFTKRTDVVTNINELKEIITTFVEEKKTITKDE